MSDVTRSVMPTGLSNDQLPIELFVGVRKSKRAAVRERRRRRGFGRGLEGRRGHSFDAEIARARFDVEPAVAALAQVKRAAPRGDFRPHRLRPAGFGIEDHHVRPRHPDEAGDRAVAGGQRVIIHVHVVHPAIMSEYSGSGIVAGQIGGPITADPDASVGVLVHSAGERCGAGVDCTQVFCSRRRKTADESVFGRIEAQQVTGIRRSDIELFVGDRRA